LARAWFSLRPHHKNFAQVGTHESFYVKSSLMVALFVCSSQKDSEQAPIFLLLANIAGGGDPALFACGSELVFPSPAPFFLTLPHSHGIVPLRINIYIHSQGG